MKVTRKDNGYFLIAECRKCGESFRVNTESIQYGGGVSGRRQALLNVVANRHASKGECA